jgi:P4 family phage/plasmid primase-like protien
VTETSPAEGSYVDPEALRDPELYLDRGRLLAENAARAVTAFGPVGRGLDQQLWTFTDGVWIPGDREIHERIVDLLQNRYSIGHQRNIESYLMGMRELPVIESKPVGAYLNFRNLMLDWSTGTVYAHSEAVLSTVQLGCDWNPSARCGAWLGFLGQVVPTDAVPFMQELFGYLLYSGNPLEKAFMFIGSGRNGKGVTLAVANALLGPGNVSKVKLQDLGGNRFATADLFGRLANIAGDLDGTMLSSTGAFKEVVGNDEIRAERKGRDSFRFRPFAKHLFAANIVPMSVDTTVGFMDRWVVLKFPNHFDQPDTTLKDRLTSGAELEGVAAWAVEGLRRLMARGGFDLPPSMVEAKEEFELAVDPLRLFLREACDRREGDSTPISKVYPVYNAWCGQQQRKGLSKHQFNERIATVPGVDRVRVDGVEVFKGLVLTKSRIDFATEPW